MFKKGMTVASALLVTASLMAPVSAAPALVQEDGKIRVLITVDKAANANSVNANLQATYGKRNDFASKGFTTDVTAAQLEALQKNKNISVSRVETHSIDSTTQISTDAVTTAVSDRTPWGIQAVYNNPTIASTFGGAGITVAVLDTGVHINHADLAGQADQCKDFSQTASLVDNTCTDRQGHGTHVAGTVLADGGTNGVYGVAPQARLWAYKVLNDQGSGYGDDIAYAIRHAADQASASGKKLIISMSLGSSGKDTLISDACTYAVGKGVLVIAAAGNSGYAMNTIGFPGGLSNVVAVAALENVQASGNYRVADYSSRGQTTTATDYTIVERDVEIALPGSAVESTWYTGGYNIISGTSMATPHASGLAAKIWASNSTMTAAQVRATLQSRAKTNDIAGGYYAAAGNDAASGFGFPRVASTDTK